jgi:7 transmembrane sweet-taste receptor of 3 GCPR
MTPFRFMLAWFRVFLFFGCIATYATNAAVPCKSNEDCEKLYSDLIDRASDGWERPVVSMCLPNGFCSNPFHGGCLRLFGDDEQRRRIRVCNSDDTYFREHPWANNTIEALHDCTARPNDLRYPELRVHHANWESSVFVSWIYQIFLSEVMGVPTSVGLRTGANTAMASFYSLENEMPFSELSYPYWGLVKANEMKDGNCSKTTEDCANVLPEVWAPMKDFQPYVGNGTVESPIASGQVAIQNFYIPDFTVQAYPFLAIHYGYEGEEKRRFLAETFKKPLTWREYCEEVSNSSCAEPDETATRPPDEDTIETTMYFAEGDYTGYFQKTEQNDCDGNLTTCTGYLSAPPCSWNIYPHAQLYWNGIVGLKVVHYESASIRQVWRAAHATKSHVIVGWYQPDVLVQEFFATNASFQEISFPPPTDVCVSHRVSQEQRCSASLEERRGDERGACGNEILQLKQLVASSLRISTDAQTNEAKKSPAFDFIKNVRISELDINHIFQQWLELHDTGDKYGGDARTAVCKWVAEHYSDLSIFMPRGHPRELSSTSQYFAWYVSLAQVFGILIGLTAVVAMSLVFRYRDTKVMVFAQPLFLLFILLGFMFVCTGAALLAVEPTQEICISVMWFVLLGYSIELIPVLVKTAAINKLIQSSKKSKRVNIERSRLIFDVAVVTTMVLIYLICWTVIDPPGRYENRRIKRDDPWVVELDLTCASELDFWKIAAFVWEIMLLAMAALLAFQSRNVLKEFNESNTCKNLSLFHLLIWGYICFVHQTAFLSDLTVGIMGKVL